MATPTSIEHPHALSHSPFFDGLRACVTGVLQKPYQSKQSHQQADTIRGIALKQKEAIRSRLLLVKDRLEELGIPWVVFAGAAAYCYGSEREITDVDILVRCEELEKARAALASVDFQGFDLGCGAEIEVAQSACPFFLDDEMMEKAEWKMLFNVKVPVISVEDNIVFKAILQRGEDEGKFDVEDIKSMIEQTEVDLQYLKRRIQLSKAEKRAMPLLRTLIPNL